MKANINKRILIAALAVIISCLNMQAINLWVGQTYTWDFGSSVMGSTYNMNVSSNGGYLSITGSGFYRNITPTQYFSGTVTVTAEWDYTLYYGDTKKHQKLTLTISCNENPVSIYPTSVTLSPGETYQLGYSHKYQNEYVGAANAYFSGGNSSFSVSSSGLITAKSPGTGYVNVYSKVSSAANAPYCYVTVKEVEPTGASIGNVSLLADQSKELSVSVSPSNATVKSKQWYVKSGSDVVSISGQSLKGLKPGTATIYCMVNGSIRSNDATVTVTEPKLTNSGTMPAADATGISVFVNPAVTYSHAISKGEGFNSISFTANGSKVEGSVELSGSILRFLPAKPLNPQTVYKLFVPRNAVSNKWGSPAQSDVTLSFKTGDREKATISMTPVSGSYLTVSSGVTLTATPSNATIYFTTDGSTPTTSSSVYTESIKENRDFTLRAFAVCEGYENSEIVTGEYRKSQSEITGYYPIDSQPLFNYAYITPWLKLSGTVEKSNNFRRISLKDGAGNDVAGEAFITHYLVIFVPDKPLENCMEYTMDIPRDAVKTSNGEVFKGFTWTFTTPTMPSGLAMQGDESVFVLSENGELTTRGMYYQTTSPADGSFTYKDYDRLSQPVTGVDDISGGYTHRLIRKGDAVTGYGMAMCGETGTASSISAIGGAKIAKAGFQTSAIIGKDNSLWMCGRNDFYQLGNGTGTTSKEFIRVADGVLDVALGNGFTLYVDTDNVLWAVGRNHMGQLGDGTRQNRKEPVKIMESVEKVYASASGFFSACITTDGNLLTWGDNSQFQLGRGSNKYYASPDLALKNVVAASLGESHALALCDNYKLYSWGSNKYGQIAPSGELFIRPTVMAHYIVGACAGPNTSLIQYVTGQITGWGRKTHDNFGSGYGNASSYVVAAGRVYSSLNSVSIEPPYFEAAPDSRFALIAHSKPIYADYDIVEWSSNNPNVAQVDDHGVIHTEGIGKATITVKLTDRFGVSKTGEATIVCSTAPDNSGVSETWQDSNEWYAYSNGTSIVVENANVGQVYAIYNLQGINIGTVLSDSSRIVFEVNQPGVYMIKSGPKVVKVIF